MLSLTVAFKIHACCAQYDTVPLTFTSPLEHVMNLFNAETRVDLPEPTGPTTMVREPGFTSKSTSESSNGFSSTMLTSTTLSLTTTTSSFFSSFTSFLDGAFFFGRRPGGPGARLPRALRKRRPTERRVATANGTRFGSIDFVFLRFIGVQK